jgi:hypothetical protein
MILGMHITTLYSSRTFSKLALPSMLSGGFKLRNFYIDGGAAAVTSIGTAPLHSVLV